MKSFLLTVVIIASICFGTVSCKGKNYITYYNKANASDSIYKINNDTLVFIKKYKKLYRKYRPGSSIEELQKMEQYIILADKYNKKFGSQKRLNTMLQLTTPLIKTNKALHPIYKKYGMDSLSIQMKIANTKDKMNKRLIDSFSVAFVRDQEAERQDYSIMAKNDLKNAKLLQWTFENYGYPSIQKIGLFGNNGVFMPMVTLLSHMAGMEEYYPYFKEKLLEYVKSGDCPPINYATMIDRYEYIHKRNILYGVYVGDFSDTIKVNQNRRSIGLKSKSFK
jgi:hypothetical protein